MPWPVGSEFRFGDSMNKLRNDNREPFYLNRPDYGVIRQALKNAVEEMLTKDWDLVALGCHEQSLAHRIAVYLEPGFPKYHTDCEYNRRKHFIKDYPAEKGRTKKKMRPDIIVHRRNSVENVLAVEMKANSNNSSSNDPQKLKALHSDAAYLYKGTAFVRIYNSLRDIRHGCLRADIHWYDVQENRLTERKQEKATIEVEKLKDQVLGIYNARRNAHRSQ